MRIGINVGDVIVEDDDIFGDGVNISARLEALAPVGGICVSQAGYEQVRDKVDLTFDDLGEQRVKNLARPLRMFQVRVAAARDPAMTAPPLPGRPSIAVLPFANIGGDPEQDYFADGMVEDIITGLSRFRSFFVIARNSTFTYKGRAVDVRQVGRELGVRYVLEGSVRKGGNRLRITVQLVEARGHTAATRPQPALLHCQRLRAVDGDGRSDGGVHSGAARGGVARITRRTATTPPPGAPPSSFRAG